MKKITQAEKIAMAKRLLLADKPFREALEGLRPKEGQGVESVTITAGNESITLRKENGMAETKKIVIDGVDKISMTYSHDTEKHETKRKVSLSLDIEDSQAREIEKAMALNAVWSVQLTVISKQLPMGDVKE